MSVDLRWIAVIALSGCYELGQYQCEGDGQCQRAPEGQCEEEGYCSYPDDSCPAERRFDALAEASIANTCVRPPEGTTSANSTGSAGSFGSSSGETGLDECGNGVIESGEDCDDGNEDDGDACNNLCRFPAAVRWFVTVPGESGGRDIARAAILLTSGDVVVGGELDAGDGALQPWFARLAAGDGDEAWRVLVETDSPGTARVSALVLGQDATIGVGGVLPNSEGEGTAWIAKYDSNGERVWSSRPFLGRVDAVADSDGDVVGVATVEADAPSVVATLLREADGAPAWTASLDDFPGQATGGVVRQVGEEPEVYGVGTAAGDAVVFRLRPSPTLLSTIDASNQLSDGFQGLTSTGENLIAAGFVTTSTAHDAWLAAFAWDGSLQWQTEPLRSNEFGVDDEFEAVAVDSAGEIFATGFTTELDKDVWVVCFDPSGVERWRRSFPELGAPDGVARAIAVSADSIVIGGEVDGVDGSRDAFAALLERPG